MSRFLGQVFLKNTNIQKKISEFVCSTKGDYFVEIGPGPGSITDHIYSFTGDKLMMIELDDRLIQNLKTKFPLATIIHDDFLKVNFDHLSHFEKVILFGNIPYYITSSIFIKFLSNPIFKQSVFMVQKEFYELLVAKPKTNRYSCISVLVQSFATVKKVMHVGRNNFHPIPKVDSSVVYLVKDKNEILDFEKYSLFLRKCFSMPRKTLWNNLKKHYPLERVNELFLKKQIDPRVRPDELSFSMFVEIFNEFLKED